MEYTRQTHEARKGKVQEMTNFLRDLASANGLEPGRETVLSGFSDKGLVEIGFTAPGGTKNSLRMFGVEMSLVEGGETFFRVSFDADTGEVGDSARFDDAGNYLDHGHIQYWCSLRLREQTEGFIDWLRSLLGATETWRLIPKADAIL